jgi:hypothetical protein
LDARSVTVELTVAVTVVFVGKANVGVNVRVLPLHVVAPAIGVVASNNATAPEFTTAQFTASLKDTVIAAVAAFPALAAVGVTADTVGATASAGDAEEVPPPPHAVTNTQTNGTSS